VSVVVSFLPQPTSANASAAAIITSPTYLAFIFKCFLLFDLSNEFRALEVLPRGELVTRWPGFRCGSAAQQHALLLGGQLEHVAHQQISVVLPIALEAPR